MKLLANEYRTGKDIVFTYNENDECLMYEDNKIVSLGDLYVSIQNYRLFLNDLFNDVDVDFNEDEFENNFHFQIFIEIVKGKVKISKNYYEGSSEYLTDCRGCWGSTIVYYNEQPDADHWNKENAQEVMEELIESLSQCLIIDYKKNKIHSVKVQ